MNFSKRQFIIIGAIFLVFGLLAYLVISNSKTPPDGETFTLTVWGTDDKEVFSAVGDAYRALRPGATIVYKKIDPNVYSQTLTDALAASNGPDVFYVQNHDIPTEKGKFYPADRGQFGLSSIDRLFPTVVRQDLVASGTEIYALPLYVDTLSLIYNKDIFDQAGIVSPPATWAEFLSDVPKLKIINQKGQVTRAAAAIGGTEKSVDSGMDLLILLMLQNGVAITNDPISLPNFTSPSSSNALNFYLQFANPASPSYTWNEDQVNSVDAFSAGTTAIIFNYQSAQKTIKNKSPFLNFAAAPVPQARVSENRSYASYHALAVSKQSAIPNRAWDFVIQTTTNETVARAYAHSSGRPPALRALIGEKINDPELGVFANSALTARSWYHIDNSALHEIMNAMISSVLTGESTTGNALTKAQQKLKLLYDKDTFYE